jgi:hypothetical protein
MPLKHQLTKHLPRSLLLTTLLFISSIGLTQTALADTCPAIASIFSSAPDSSDMVTYLSPGWHSELMQIDDLDELSFNEVYANATGMRCVYDTESGYIELIPNNNQQIDTSSLVGNDKWHCAQQEFPSYPLGTQRACTCNESLEVCSFTSQ